MANITGTNLGETLSGTTADDLIRGLGGDDTLHGGGGVDYLYGGDGDDRIYGGSGGGNDFLYGGDGDDWLEGGDWTDSFYGGAGIDTVSYSNLSNGVRIDLAARRVTFIGQSWAPEILDSIENAVGTDLADVLIGDAGANVLRGAGGDDELHGGGGVDRLYGDDGDDRIYGGAGDGNDFLYGGNGDDWLFGGGWTDHFDGGDGSDWVSYDGLTNAVRIDLKTGYVTFPGKTWARETMAGIENLVGTAFNDTLIGDGQANSLRGGAGNDNLYGGEGDDVLSGGRGSNYLSGGVGIDTADYSSRGAVRVDLSAGTVEHGAFVDRLASVERFIFGAGADWITGAGRADYFDGGDGDDVIFGGSGNDTFFYSLGSDTIYGGSGRDTFVNVQDYTQLPNYVYPGHYNPVHFYYEKDEGPDLIIDLSLGTITNTEDDRIWTIKSIEDVRTGVGDDVVIGSNGKNTIHVGPGSNYVAARGGDDVVYGSASRSFEWIFGSSFDDDMTFSSVAVDNRSFGEEIYGGAGNDKLYGGTNMFGGSGNDKIYAAYRATTMEGGSGADQFIFSAQPLTYRGLGIKHLTQSGTISDFDPHEGDKILIDWAGIQGDPIFVEEVPAPPTLYTMRDFQYPFIFIDERSIYVGVAANVGPLSDVFHSRMLIEVPNYEGELTRDDVVFV